MRRFLFSLLVLWLTIAAWLPAPAIAAVCGDGLGGNSCFWIPGAGAANWSATTNWSLTDGGVSCTCTPSTGDDIFFTANSGTNGSTINSAISIRNFDATGSSALTLTHNAVTLTVTGTTFKFAGSISYTAASSSRLVSFTGASGPITLTSGGKTFGAVTINVTAGVSVVLADALSVLAGGTLTHTQGTLDAGTNNVAVTAGVFSASGAGTRVFNGGTNTWTISGTSGTPWDFSGTNITVTAMPGTLLISSAAAASRVVNLGTSRSYNTVTFANTGSNSYELSLTATTPTIATWNLTAPIVVKLPTSTTTFTVTNAITWAGTASSSVISVVGGTSVTTISSAAASTPSWVVLGSLTFTGGGSIVASNCINVGGLTSITCNGPSGGSGGLIIGGYVLRRDLGHANDNTPLWLDVAA